MTARWNLCLAVLWLGAAIPALATQSPSAAAKAADTAAYQQWQADAASTLDKSDNADALLTAAMMQTTLIMQQVSPMVAQDQPAQALRRDARERKLRFMDRATAREPGAADLAAFALNACMEIPTCDAATYAAHLRRIAPTDALVWWAALRQAEADKDPAAITANLLSMGDAETFNDYWASYYQRLRRGLDEAPLPPLSSTPSPEMDGATANDLRNVYAIGLASAVALPAYANVTKPCRPDDVHFAERRTACRAIGILLQRGARTMISYRIGLALQRQAANDEADYQAALAAGRRLEWQFEAFYNTLLGPEPDRDQVAAAQARDYLDAIEQTGGELAAIQSLLKNAGFALDPPADWVDKDQQARLAHDQRFFKATREQHQH